MNKNVITTILILIILAGVGLFALSTSATTSYLAIGQVIIAFIGLLLATRKKVFYH